MYIDAVFLRFNQAIKPHGEHNDAADKQQLNKFNSIGVCIRNLLLVHAYARDDNDYIAVDLMFREFNICLCRTDSEQRAVNLINFPMSKCSQRFC